MDEQWNLVEEIKKLSVGERAALRREAGGKLCDASGRALAAFYRLIPPGLSSRKQECWFCVLTLACLWNVEEARRAAACPSCFGNWPCVRLPEAWMREYVPAGYPVGGRRVSVRQAV